MVHKSIKMIKHLYRLFALFTLKIAIKQQLDLIDADIMAANSFF